MIGIESIGAYLPEGRQDNFEQARRLGMGELKVERRIGIRQVARKAADQTTSDLCVRAYQDLRTPAADADFICVVTQNGDYPLPHTSAVLHGKLGLTSACAAFDLSLGCSGYPYALAVARSFMEAGGLRKGLLFTCDPYSDIVDGNTELLFGDAATVTLLSDAPRFRIGRGTWATEGRCHEDLIVRGGKLHMRGDRVFRFAVERTPEEIKRCLRANSLSMDDPDLFLLHQGSAAIRNALMKKLDLAPERVPFEVVEYGNTVSSSIPLLLRRRLDDAAARRILLCGFGVGLSVGTLVIERIGGAV